jgi:hypothetical protein
MRGYLTGALILAVLVAVAVLVWWNAARIEAWAEDTKQDWAAEQDRQRVRHAEAFLRKGLEQLDGEIARAEGTRHEHLVSSEEARLRAVKQEARVAEAEQVAVEFARAQRAARGQAFEFVGRTFVPALAEAQLDQYVREVQTLREALDELHYQEVAHRAAANQLAQAATTLKSAREQARREGDRLLVKRDVTDAGALARDLDVHTGLSGSDLQKTLELLRTHVLRREAEGAVQSSDGPDSVDGTLRRKKAQQREEEFRRLREQILDRAR